MVAHLPDLDWMRWKRVPTFDQLWKTLNLGYKFLKGNQNESFSQRQALIALKLVNDPLPLVISQQAVYNREKNVKDPVNQAIDFVLKFQRKHASFEIPKLLAVIESIQKYTFKKSGIDDCGDYSMFASMLENEQIDGRFQFLIDYGVPSSAIKKISEKVDKSVSGDNSIMKYIREHAQKIYPLLLPYERQLLLNAIDNNKAN